jgi:hypothetical protein
MFDTTKLAAYYLVLRNPIFDALSSGIKFVIDVVENHSVTSLEKHFYTPCTSKIPFEIYQVLLVHLFSSIKYDVKNEVSSFMNQKML